MKRIVMDLDNTLTIDSDLPYEHKEPNWELIKKCREYRTEGFEIVIFTARNMKTYNGNQGKIVAHTLPIIIDWLKRHEVPYDENYIGKPWCGTDGFYVDDRAIRPNEFVELSYVDVVEVIEVQNTFKSLSDSL